MLPHIESRFASRSQFWFASPCLRRSEVCPPLTKQPPFVRVSPLSDEQRQLERELRALEKSTSGTLPLSSPASPSAPIQPAEKIALFLRLFAARRSVFPRFWENLKTGKKGYAPACDNEWRHGVCEKPRIKCTDCPHQKFPALDAGAVEAHLRGTHTIGTYANRSFVPEAPALDERAIPLLK